MSKYISVPVTYGIYELSDDTFELLPNGMKAYPVQVVLEMLVMNGNAKKIGNISAAAIHVEETAEIGEDEEGEDSPWVEDHE